MKVYILLATLAALYLAQTEALPQNAEDLAIGQMMAEIDPTRNFKHWNPFGPTPTGKCDWVCSGSCCQYKRIQNLSCKINTCGVRRVCCHA